MDNNSCTSEDKTRPAFRVSARIPYDQVRNSISRNEIDEFWATLLDARTYKSDKAPETNEQFERTVARGFGRQMKKVLSDDEIEKTLLQNALMEIREQKEPKTTDGATTQTAQGAKSQ